MSSGVETVRRFYHALRSGNVQGVVAVLDEKIEWREAEYFPYYSGTWHGPQAVVENLLVPISRDWDGFQATPVEFIEQGERVISLGTYSGTCRKTGRRLSVAFAHAWTVRGGKLASFDMFTDTAKVLEALKP
jgi:uncharacterized protein